MEPDVGFAISTTRCVTIYSKVISLDIYALMIKQGLGSMPISCV